jgi:CheY-like chemotaxis protein
MARVLVVDDEEVVRSLLHSVLEPAGHQVLDASDGAEALRVVRRESVDVVFCDLFMPGQDGMETIRDLRRDFPGVPVVAISGGGYGGRVDLLPVARLLGAAQALKKPFRPESVLDAVRQALAGGAPEAGEAAAP